MSIGLTITAPHHTAGGVSISSWLQITATAIAAAAAIASAQSGARLFQLWNPQCSCALGGIKSIISIPTSEEMKTPRIVPRRGLSLRMPSQTHIATLISQRTLSPRYVIVIVLNFPCASAQ